MVIKDSLEVHIARLEADPVIAPERNSSLLDIFTADYSENFRSPTNQSPLVDRVWAHAALIYLFVVVSGWQPASGEVRYHVRRILDLLKHQISPPALLRTMVWPFCLAGCLAEPAQEACFQGMVDALQPPSVFGTVRKALEIMKNVWQNRGTPDAASRDFATWFGDQGDLVLLV
ncbi:transcription factor [Hyphodiscus hymeniophilus]|uniref:Transcription factor n=1 Tax=Hyphodiscus hymeniophilus TaxID=353542 RepID=A0A9P6VPQ4_9HELO|nr:transcription factor [Hyphodiscus hymeniophilus]